MSEFYRPYSHYFSLKFFFICLTIDMCITGYFNRYTSGLTPFDEQKTEDESEDLLSNTVRKLLITVN